jgi:signal peptidase I
VTISAPQRSLGSSILGFIRDVVVILAIAIVVSFVVKTFLIRSFFIPSASMQTTLMAPDPTTGREADRVIVNELVPDVMPISHGDIVVFRDPGGWLPASAAPASMNPIQVGAEWVLSLFGLASPDSNEHLIKRVIGLPGDTVVCCTPTGELTINGTPIIEPYINPNTEGKASAVDFSVTVPEGALWVMGDNRNNSADSRFHPDQPGRGFVGIDDVVGRAFVISWPVSRWTWLSNYPDVFQDVPAPPALPAGFESTPTVGPRK